MKKQTQKTKKIPASVSWTVTIATCITLFITLLSPCIYGVSFKSTILLASFQLFLLAVICGLCTYNSKIDIECLKKEIRKWKRIKNEYFADYEKEKQEKEANKIQYEQLLEQYQQKLERKGKSLEKIKAKLRELYMVSTLEDTRKYADMCLKLECVELFNPIRYVNDTHYAKVIDANAEALLETLTMPNGYSTQYNIEEVRSALNALLKRETTTNSTSSDRIKERQKLDKLER